MRPNSTTQHRAVFVKRTSKHSTSMSVSESIPFCSASVAQRVPPTRHAHAQRALHNERAAMSDIDVPVGVRAAEICDASPRAAAHDLEVPVDSRA